MSWFLGICTCSLVTPHQKTWTSMFHSKVKFNWQMLHLNMTKWFLVLVSLMPWVLVSLDLTANQNPLKAAFSPIFWSQIWSCILLRGKLGRRFRKSKTRALLLGGVTTHSSTPPPALPALQGFLSAEQNKHLLQMAAPALLLYIVFALNTTLLPMTHASASCGWFSYLHRGSQFGNTDTF